MKGKELLEKVGKAIRKRSNADFSINTLNDKELEIYRSWGEDTEDLIRIKPLNDKKLKVSQFQTKEKSFWNKKKASKEFNRAEEYYKGTECKVNWDEYEEQVNVLISCPSDVKELKFEDNWSLKDIKNKEDKKEFEKTVIKDIANQIDNISDDLSYDLDFEFEDE